MDLHLDPKSILQQAPSKLENGGGAKGKKKDDPEALKAACREFEAILTQSMFKGMRDTLPEGGVLKRNQAQEFFEEMMDMEVAKQSAQGQGLGIADVLFQQLSKVEVEK